MATLPGPATAAVAPCTPSQPCLDLSPRATPTRSPTPRPLTRPPLLIQLTLPHYSPTSGQSATTRGILPKITMAIVETTRATKVAEVTRKGLLAIAGSRVVVAQAQVIVGHPPTASTGLLSPIPTCPPLHMAVVRDITVATSILITLFRPDPLKQHRWACLLISNAASKGTTPPHCVARCRQLWWLM